MTRINSVPVRELTDQHLLAEFREITRVYKLAQHLDDYGKYKMGEGHVKFFYNKGKYLAMRTDELYKECKKRGFDVQKKLYKSHPAGLNEHWFPTDLDRDICRARIMDRINERPEFYTYYRQKITQ